MQKYAPTNMPNWLSGADAFRTTALGYAADGEVQTALPNVDNDAIADVVYLGQTPDYATSVRLTGRMVSSTIPDKTLKGTLKIYVKNQSTGTYVAVDTAKFSFSTVTLVLDLGSNPTTYVGTDGRRRVDVRIEVAGPRKSNDWQLELDEAVLIPTPPSTRGNK